MLRKTVLILFFSLASITLHAFDNSSFNEALHELSENISQAAYSLSERADSGEQEAFTAAAERADTSEKRIRDLISSLESPADFSVAEKTLADFAAAGNLNSHTVAVVEKMLKQRVAFINATMNADSNISVTASGRSAIAPQQLLNSRQRRMIIIEVPVVEAVISLEDTKENRRIDNLKAIFKRHNCKVISDNSTEKDKSLIHGIYFSGRKHVVDALLGHFGGDVVQADLKAIVKITCGGFWSGKKSLEFMIAPKTGNSVMGELSWFKSVVEKDPARYLSENGFNEIKTLGSVENIAGEQKVLLKNTVAEIWVTSKNGSARNAFYSSRSELGDIYINAQ